jgi:hypothetical protein
MDGQMQQQARLLQHHPKKDVPTVTEVSNIEPFQSNGLSMSHGSLRHFNSGY